MDILEQHHMQPWQLKTGQLKDLMRKMAATGSNRHCGNMEWPKERAVAMFIFHPPSLSFEHVVNGMDKECKHVLNSDLMLYLI